MYNEHFGLSQSPFRITPDTTLFYTGGGRGEILEALVYAITSGEGIIKITGEVGTGKTMLCRMLEHRLPDNVDLVYLANPSLTPTTSCKRLPWSWVWRRRRAAPASRWCSSCSRSSPAPRRESS